MDLDDWEYLPDATHLLRHHQNDDEDHRVAAVKRPLRSYVFAVNSVFDMDYFTTPDSISHRSPPSPRFIPFQFRSPTDQAEEVVKRLLQDTADQKQQQQQQEQQPDNSDQDAAAVVAAATQVFFKTNEFVDMKCLDSTSPRSKTTGLIADFRFDDEKSDDASNITISPRKINSKLKFDDQLFVKNDVNWIGEGIIGDDCGMDDDDDGGFNLWKLGFGGIGAICSFGVAAATICLIMFGNSQTTKQNHKLMFHFYADDTNKRMKHVVDQATKFNEAMSAAVRGVHVNSAHITYGGYYENAL